MLQEIKNGKVEGIASAKPIGKSGAEDRALKHACKEFEGVLISMILKEGLKKQPDSDDDGVPGEDIFREYAAEQAARELGRNEAMGLAKMLYNQLTGGHKNVE